MRCEIVFGKVNLEKGRIRKLIRSSVNFFADFCKGNRVIENKLKDLQIAPVQFYNSTVSFLITDSVEMEKISQKFTRQDGSTTELTFPYSDMKNNGNQSVCGDIVINFENTDYADLSRVVFHAMLNLIFHNHVKLHKSLCGKILKEYVNAEEE